MNGTAAAARETDRRERTICCCKYRSVQGNSLSVDVARWCELESRSNCHRIENRTGTITGANGTTFETDAKNVSAGQMSLVDETFRIRAKIIPIFSARTVSVCVCKRGCSDLFVQEREGVNVVLEIDQ